MDAALVKKWESVVSRFHELTDQLMDPSVLNQPAQLRKLTKERAELEPGVTLFEAYRDAAKQLEDAAQILADPSAGQELHRMAADESAALERVQRDMEEQAKEFLIPKDPRDEKSLILEIRAGTGGDEAALFAGQLFRLYTRYAEKKGLIKTEKFSRTKVVKLTDEFEKYFGKSVEDLKKLLEDDIKPSSS
jgi:peptide chain release factor 1